MCDDIGPFMAEGSYAQVHSSVSDADFVWRLEIVEDPKFIDRQIQIHRQMLDKKVGPCFPAIRESHIIYLEDMPTHLRERIKRRMLEWGLEPYRTEIWAQKLERGQEGMVFASTRDVQNTLFMLMWSVWAANSRFGFRHRDIKGQNIVIKRLKKSKKLTFRVNGMASFQVKTDCVPLLVDYGFASITTSKNRHNMGTFTTAPPEFMAHALLYSGYGISIDHNGLFSEDGYDMWSIAIAVLLPAIGLKSIHEPAKWVVKKNLDELVNTRGMDNDTKDAYVALFRVCYLQKALNHGVCPPRGLVPKFYSNYMWTTEFEERLQTFDKKHKISKAFADRYEQLHGRDLKRALRRLLSWDPERRVMSGKIYNFFRHTATLVDEQESDYEADLLPLLDFQK